MKKTAMITGITGQDGAYLAKLLLKKEYIVVGLLRNLNIKNIFALEYLGVENDIIFDSCDLDSFESVFKLVKKYNPKEIYNMAAQSSVGLSFENPLATISFNVNSVVNILESIRLFNNKIKFYQASSSEMIGKINDLPLNENSIFHPMSPYGISKAAAHWTTVNYRESYGIFATSGILFNHESFLRKNNFFIKKVIRQSLEIIQGKRSSLIVGNVDVKRDFGYAPKYVEAIYLMMQHEFPSDYVICSGKSISLREIIEYVFLKLDISKTKLIIEEKFFRPNEIYNIYGDSSKAKKVLKWEYDFDFYDIIDLLIEEERNFLLN